MRNSVGGRGISSMGVAGAVSCCVTAWRVETSAWRPTVIVCSRGMVVRRGSRENPSAVPLVESRIAGSSSAKRRKASDETDLPSD